MKLFIDSGNLKEIETLVPLGIIDGVTTNPSLLAKEPGDYREILKKICEIVKGPVSAEVVATDFDGHDRARAATSRASTSTSSSRCRSRGTASRRARRCRREGNRVNVTLCFSAAQALLAAKVGATFVSPFVGRLDDIATAGMDLIREIVEIFDNYEFKTEVLVASDARPDAHRRSGAHGRRHLHLSAGGDRGAVQASADRHRAREVPEGLGEGAGGQSRERVDGAR